jgi:ribosome modulation factor
MIRRSAAGPPVSGAVSDEDARGTILFSTKHRVRFSLTRMLCGTCRRLTQERDRLERAYAKSLALLVAGASKTMVKEYRELLRSAEKARTASEQATHALAKHRETHR